MPNGVIRGDKEEENLTKRAKLDNGSDDDDSSFIIYNMNSLRYHVVLLVS